MKSYKKFGSKLIGYSDYASLLLAGPRNEEGLTSQFIHFGGDGRYFAYIVNEEAEIGEHYSLVAEFDSWMRIYDDETMVCNFDAKHIKVYRAAGFGCIIQLLGKED